MNPLIRDNRVSEVAMPPYKKKELNIRKHKVFGRDKINIVMVLEGNITLVVVDMTGMTNFLVKKILLYNLTPLGKLYRA